MKCSESAALIAAYADGQVGGLRAWRVGRHLRGCAACAAKHQESLALRERLRAEIPYFPAPPRLQARVRALLASARGAEPAAPRAQQDHWRWLAAGALAGCAATVVAWVTGNAVIDWRTNQDLAVEAVALHVQANLADHLIEVASSDQHTVKPWLSARLDYSPPVRDLAGEGFPLTGARLATLHGERVATLVYRYRLHTIDVFVRPVSARSPAAPRTLRGFNVAQARGSNMDYLAVSDVNADVLSAFVQRLARPDAAQ